MSSRSQSFVSKWIRGAQTTVHEVGMFIQSIATVGGIGLFFVAVVIGWFGLTAVDKHEQYIAWKSVVATVYIVGASNPEMPVVYVNREGVGYDVPAQTMYDHPQTWEVWRRMGRGSIRGAFISIPVFVIAVTGIMLAFGRAGKKVTADEHLRGMTVETRPLGIQKELRTHGKPGVFY